jgi:predicted alpha/beta-fold hydrolase
MAVNRRGHRGRLTKQCYNFFGSASDVRYIIDACVRKARPKARVVMLGISAGSGLTARFMGEQGVFIKKRLQMGEEAGGTAKEWADITHEKYIKGYIESCIGVAPGYVGGVGARIIYR